MLVVSAKEATYWDPEEAASIMLFASSADIKESEKMTSY